MEYGRLIDFIFEEKISKSKYLDLIEFYYPYRIYLYGKQFKVNRESTQSICREKIKNRLRELYCIKQNILNVQTKKSDKINILSGAYFGVNTYIGDLGYNAVYGPWLVNGADKFVGDVSYIHDYYSFKRKILEMSFQDLISDKCDAIVGNFVAKTRRIMRENKIRAFIASSTHTMENRIPLRAAREEGIPTFVFLHGLPFPFYYEEPERADYLIVWSEKIKENFVKLTKFPESRIFVSGHPLYQKMRYSELRNTLDDILIISPSSEAERHQDRGNMIYYLMAIEKVLCQFGVKRVRFRPHPHEHAEWYLNFVNNNFFVPDDRPLNKSLESSTLVIGTLSTIAIEALYYGVNYILFDPLDQSNRNVYGHKSVPPFDGSDPFLPVANTISELSEFLSNHVCADINLYREYIKMPFDISFLKDLI